MSSGLIDEAIEVFYTGASEETRLESGMGVFEFERIKKLISENLSKDAAIILDVGGGTGKYSAWLAGLGHEVHLIDPVEKHIKRAKKRSQQLKNPFGVRKGNAQELAYSSDFADLIILHGPLYHLQNYSERQFAIQEAYRVLKNGGICLAFGINYTVSTIAGLMDGHIHHPEFFEMSKRELVSSIHNPPNSLPWLLTKGYYHRPQDLKHELLEATDFIYQKTQAVEGIIWLDKDYFTNMLIPKRKEVLIELLRITESDKNLMSFSPHFMISVRK